MRLMVDYDRRNVKELVCFCEVVTRDPFLLVGARRCDNFNLQILRRTRIGAVREVPTPWQCLQDDLRDEGIDPASLTVHFERTLAENVAALRNGQLDVIQTLEPFAEELLEAKAGDVWHAAAGRGHTSYTCFYSLRSFLVEHREILVRMTRAVFATQRWVHRASAEEIAEAIRSYFETVPLHRLVRAIARYKALAIWGRDPRLSSMGYQRLQRALLSGGLIRIPLPFEDAVDNSIAEEALATNRSEYH